MTEPRRVLVCGSTSFPLTPELGAQIVDEMRALGDVIFLTRTAKAGFDRFVAGVASALGRPCIQFIGSGRDNFERDVQMVEAADEVLLFFDPAQLDIAADTGTQHVAEVALTKRKPVRAWSAHDSQLIFAGAHP